MFFLKSFFIRFLKLLRHRSFGENSLIIPAYAGLGNFIMMTPAILEYRRRFPSSSIYLLTWPTYGTDMVFNAPTLRAFRRTTTSNAAAEVINGVYLLDPKASFIKKFLFFLSLRRLHLEVGWIPFDACPPFVWWGFVLAGISRIYTHDGTVLGWPKTWTSEVADKTVPVNRAAHETEIHFNLLELHLRDLAKLSPGDQLNRLYETYVSADSEDLLKKYSLQPQQYIVIQISAANNKVRTPKIWDQERWAEVIRELTSRGETVVLPGDENEKPLIDAFVKRNALSRALNLAGKTTVREISTIIKHAKLLLVHDSGLMHIGNAHHTPLIALYGPTDWNFTMPKAPTSRILRKNLPCQPCMAQMSKTEEEALRDCPFQVQCMKEISVADVLAAAEEALKS